MSGISEIVAFGKELLSRTTRHRLVDHAAKMAYYSFLSLFPLILLLFALAGLIGGHSAFEWTMEQMLSIMPREAAEYLGGFVYEVTDVQRPEVVPISLLLLLYSASSAVAAMIESLNEIFEVPESRPWWRRNLLAVSAVVVFSGFYLVGIPAVLAGPEILGKVGLGVVWQRFHWPMVFTGLTAVIWVLYLRLPNYPAINIRRLALLGGALIGMFLWAAVTQGFQLYLTNFERFASLYGVVTGILVMMIWLHMSAFAILFGAEFGATIWVHADSRVRR